MEDKTFELVTILYSEFNKFLKTRFARLESEVASIAKSQICLENDLKPKAEALLDGYKLLYEKVNEHDRRFDRIDKKFEEHDRRFDTVEKRLDTVDERLDRVEKRLDTVDERLDGVDKRIIRVEKQVNRIDGKIGGVESLLLKHLVEVN